MSNTVVGVFDSDTQAQAAREALIRSGFGESDVQIQSHPASGPTGDSAPPSSDRSGAPEGLMANVGHFFRELFGDDDGSGHAGHYSEAVRRGGSVVAVTASSDDRIAQAQQALAQAGAVDIEQRAAAWSQSGYQGFDAAQQPYTAEQIDTERGKVLPVVQEQLEVGKREVDLGAVRVYSRTVSTPVSETVQLHEQHAAIERRPVDRPATAADMAAFEGGSIEVRESAERAVVGKTARVVEEVVVGSVGSTREETVSDTVRNTVVEVQQPGHVEPYRAHYEQNFAATAGADGYGGFEPAYAYGSSLRTDSRYADRTWADVEADAQRDWTTRHPESTWERMKGAIRHGWESATR